MGLSSSAAQRRANPASMPASLLQITGVIPFSETILQWQSLVFTILIALLSLWIAWRSAPTARQAITAQQLGIRLTAREDALTPRLRPGEWLEYSPILTLVLVALGALWLWQE